ncbi:hypothetical protein JCM19000A_29970 [Silvimonas sp. JCM 19000]
MGMIALGLTLALLWVNLAGLAHLVQRRLPDIDLARAVGVLALCLALFFVEHFVGLGSLAWAWPVCTVLSVIALRKVARAAAWWEQHYAFVLAFLLALSWRFVFPDLDAQSEHLTDLFFIANYLPGQTLPPPDQWLPGYRFDMYYGFLHYAAALQARFLHLDAGRAMNLGFCTTFGLIGSLVWSLSRRWLSGRAPRVLLAAAVLIGGTGVAPLIPLIYDLPHDDASAVTRLWSNTRFVGLYDQQVNTSLGQALFPRAEAGTEPRDLPLETLSYYTYLGDLHPPLGGFALLFLTLGLMGVLAWRNRPDAGDALPPATTAAPSASTLTFLIGLAQPVLLALNPWTLPLQGLLVLGWAVWQHRAPQGLAWHALLAGLIVGALAIYPFLTHFAPNALGTPIRLVQPEDHTPVRQFLALWWPVLWLLAITLSAGPKARGSWWAAWGVIVLLAITEIVFVDDPNAGRYNRFNAVIKWWSWLYPAALAVLGIFALALPCKLRRVLAWMPLLAVCLYVIPQAQYWAFHPKTHAGRLAGEGWLYEQQGARSMVTYLRNAPRGLVLEGLDAGSYSVHGAYALHSGQPSALGWPDHEGLWRNQPWFIGRDADMVRALYHGGLPDAGRWAADHRIRYIVWSQTDQQRDAAALERMKTALAGQYIWRAFNNNNGQEVGLWERR